MPSLLHFMVMIQVDSVVNSSSTLYQISTIVDSSFPSSYKLGGVSSCPSEESDVMVDWIECLWRPFDINPPPDGPDMDQQIIMVRNRIQGLSDYWVEYYRMSCHLRYELIVGQAGLSPDHFYVQERESLDSQSSFELIEYSG
jgi:hypothetical protein